MFISLYLLQNMLAQTISQVITKIYMQNSSRTLYTVFYNVFRRFEIIYQLWNLVNLKHGLAGSNQLWAGADLSVQMAQITARLSGSQLWSRAICITTAHTSCPSHHSLPLSHESWGRTHFLQNTVPNIVHMLFQSYKYFYSFFGISLEAKFQIQFE